VPPTAEAVPLPHHLTAAPTTFSFVAGHKSPTTLTLTQHRPLPPPSVLIRRLHHPGSVTTSFFIFGTLLTSPTSESETSIRGIHREGESRSPLSNVDELGAGEFLKKTEKGRGAGVVGGHFLPRERADRLTNSRVPASQCARRTHVQYAFLLS
jgi:hypothetical protein